MPLGKRKYTQAFGGKYSKQPRKVARTAMWQPYGYRARYRRGRLEQELKAYTANVNSGTYNSGDVTVDLTNSWNYTPLVVMSAGDAIDQRDGAKIKLAGVQLRILAYNNVPGDIVNPNSGFGTCPIRFMVVYDKYPNGTNLASGCPEVIDTTIFDDINGVMNLNNRYRFKVLWDRTVHVDPIQTYGPNTTYNLYYGQNTVKQVNKWVKLRNLPAIFNSTSAGPSSVSQGQLYLMWCSTNSVNASGFGFKAGFRLRYVG